MNCMGKKVKVYTTPICPQCHRVKKFLDEMGVEYEEIDVSKDIEKAKELFQKSGSKVVPVIEVEEKIIIGFDRKLLEDSLK